jgi:2,3-bisphosphoglycerate-independent phosphoglycerate mutase
MKDQTLVPRRPVLLVIMDGVGVNPSKLNNAVAAARTPRLDEYYFRYPFTVLSASGLAVGLPEGQMGNSEVGHMTLGSGCVVRQDLVLINDAIADGSFSRNPALSKAIAEAKRRSRPVHLFGLVSDGGVHSHLSHLIALIEMCQREGVEPVVHMVTDGRDTAPQSAFQYLAPLEQALGRGAGRIATLAGRFYAMDRDRRWDRTERAWRALVLGKGRGVASAHDAINAAYAAGENDEFIQPTVIGGFKGLADDDVVISFNFRKDRPRQMVSALANPDFDGFDRGRHPRVHLTCMMQYDRELPLPFAFTPDSPGTALNRILGARGIPQFHCAETEKYAHVTFFFNAGGQDLEPGEEHRLIPSPKVATYDLKPEMSAPQVAKTTVEAIRSGRYGFLVINFANGDMVGHTGDQSAAIRAVEALDRAVGQVLDAAVAQGYSALVTADHGNCDLMVDPETDEPHTQHTTNPVPLLVVDESRWTLAPFGSLADVAPTVLELMGLPQPREMTGRSMLIDALQAKPIPALERLDAA